VISWPSTGAHSGWISNGDVHIELAGVDLPDVGVLVDLRHGASVAPVGGHDGVAGSRMDHYRDEDGVGPFHQRAEVGGADFFRSYMRMVALQIRSGVVFAVAGAGHLSWRFNAFVVALGFGGLRRGPFVSW
jgi:hypothetical protein